MGSPWAAVIVQPPAAAVNNIANAFSHEIATSIGVTFRALLAAPFKNTLRSSTEDYMSRIRILVEKIRLLASFSKLQPMLDPLLLPLRIRLRDSS
jgi:hypothetical protein